jgi:fatty-acyl-CoA synthase
MLGYLDGGRLTSPADADGYMDTGDVADFKGGKIRITGRMKDIIIRGGINVFPGRIESVVRKIPAVEDVVVVGKPHAFWGEEIVACIISDTTSKAFEVDVHRHCEQSLSLHERPDRIVFLDSFPRSVIGKIRKEDLKEAID